MATPRPKFWVQGGDRSIIIAKYCRARFQVTVLAIHAIGDMHHRSIWPQIFCGVNHQIPAILDLFFGNPISKGIQIWCLPIMGAIFFFFCIWGMPIASLQEEGEKKYRKGSQKNFRIVH